MTERPGPQSADLERDPRKRWAYRLSNGLHLLGAFIVLPLLTVLVTADVVLRYLLDAPLTGANEIAGVMLLLILLLSLPLATAADRHIKVDLLYRSLGLRARRAAKLVAAIAGGFVSLTLAWHSFRTVPSEIRYNESTLLLQIPLWPFSLAAGCVALLLAVLFVMQSGLFIRKGR